MNKLLIMIVCCTVLAILSQRKSDSLSTHGEPRREKFFFFILTTYMVVFAGLRTYFNDTYAYITGFKDIAPFPSALKDLEWSLGENPGFCLFSSIIKTFTNNYHIFLMICSAVALCPTLWFIQKYTKNFAFSIFLCFMLGYYVFTLAAIKQTMATAIALLAVDQLIRKRNLSFVLLLLLGMTFHAYCLLYFCAPILLKQVPWKKGTWFIIICTLASAYSFNFLLGTILEITDILGYSYDSSTFAGEGVNIFRVLVYFTPVVLSFLWRRTLFEDSSKVENLFMNLTTVCAMIMFIGLFGNANMFARLALFFDPLIYISLPWMLYKLRRQLSGMILSFGAYLASPIFFYFQMVLISQFDQQYSSINIGQFLQSLYP